MSRCRSCDSILSGGELCVKNKDGSFRDLCTSCHTLIQADLDGVFDIKEYAFSDLTSSLRSELGIQDTYLVSEDSDYS